MRNIALFIITLTIVLSGYGQQVQKQIKHRTRGADAGEIYRNIPAASRLITADPNSDVLQTWALPSDGSTSGNTRAPGNSFKFQRTEYLITAAEMATSGFPSGFTIDAIGFLIATAGTTSQSGQFKVYLKNTADVTYSLGSTWTTTGFTLASDIAGWAVPITAGSYVVNFSGGSPFTYTGGGVYVAWEFSNPGTAGTGALVANCNTSLTGGLFGARSASALPTTLTVSDFRPATIFANNTIVDIANLTNIYTLERAPIPYSIPTPINVRVVNVSASAQTFDVTVTVKDPTNTITRFTSTQTVTALAANTAIVVNFTWTPTVQENVNITAATSVIPGETFTVNNSKSLSGNVNNNLYSYTYSTAGSSGFGFTFPGTGIFASRFTMNGSGTIPGANLLIADFAANVGNTIYAVVMNSAGTILSQSPNYTIVAGDLGNLKSFAFASPPTFTNEDFYIGLAQTAGAAQYYPMGTLTESPVRANTFYTAPLAGGAPTILPSTFELKYGIEAQVVAAGSTVNPSAFTATPVSTSQINLSWALNPGGNNVLVAWSSTGVFGTPVDGTTYSPGGSIAGGGTVLQYNNSTSYNHTSLSAATTYYYKVWSYNGSTYSIGTTANATTFCNATTAPFTEGFEAVAFPPVCWSLSAGAPSWIRSTSASGYGVGTASAEANFYDISASAVPFDLISLQFDASAMTTPALKFDYAYAAYDAASVDKLEVLASYDNGVSYPTSLIIMLGGSAGDMVTGGTTTSSFVPSSSQWATKTLTLPAGVNKVKFAATSAFGNNLYVDNVQVFQLYAHDVGVSIINVAQVVTLGTSSPMATVTNFGSSTETFNVTMTIGAYSSTKTVTALASFASAPVTFDPWTNSLGDYTINVCTALTTPFADQNAANDCKSQAVKVLNLNKQVYGYLAFEGSGTDAVGPTTFSLATPGTLNSLADQSALQFVNGGTWAMDTWYGTVYNTVAPYSLITLNTTTGARTVIGDMGLAMNGLSFNTSTGVMYGVSYNSGTSSTELYTINLSTGASTLVGSAAGVQLINLAINSAGACYALDITNDNLGTVNLASGAFTVVGPVGFNANYAQDMEFDRQSGELFMCAQDLSSGWLAWVNQSTGATLKIGDFEGGGEVTGFAIPYPYVPANISVAGVVTSEDVACYSATNTITVGGANPFTVQPGGSATFIAGMKISFLPGTTVQSGGYMLGYITPNDTYCGGIIPASPVTIAGQQETTTSLDRAFFTIFPNPTTGIFTIVQKGTNLYENVKIDIYGIRGDKVLTQRMIGEKEQVLDISGLPEGIYFIRVVADNYSETIKLVRTR